MKKEDIMVALAVKPEYPEFEVPSGLDVTELEDGDEKEVVAKIKKKGDRLCLVEVNGIPLAEKEADEDEDEMEDLEDSENEAREADEEAFASEGRSIENSARQYGLM